MHTIWEQLSISMHANREQLVIRGEISLQHFQEVVLLMRQGIKGGFNTNFKHGQRTCLEHWSQCCHALPIMRKICHISLQSGALQMLDQMMSNLLFSKLVYQRNNAWDTASTKIPQCNKHRITKANGFLDWPRKVLHLLSSLLEGKDNISLYFRGQSLNLLANIANLRFYKPSMQWESSYSPTV